MRWYEIFSLSMTLFLLMDSIGNIPLFISVLRNVDPARHRAIIVRELFIALGIILFFAYVGESLLNLFNVNHSTLAIAGGIILFMIAVRMIFPSADKEVTGDIKKHDPLIVPLAVPLVAGPGILSAVMIYSHAEANLWILTFSILIAWIGTFIILFFSTAIQKALKERGCEALQRLMGLILTLLAIQMFMNGIKTFIFSLER